MEKKTKLTLSGTAKKSFKNIDASKSEETIDFPPYKITNEFELPAEAGLEP